jgi:hypothetical protein
MLARLRFLIVIFVLLVTLQGSVAHAVQHQFFAPATPNPACGGYTTYKVVNLYYLCGFFAYFPRYAAGNGWHAMLNYTNPYSTTRQSASVGNMFIPSIGYNTTSDFMHIYSTAYGNDPIWAGGTGSIGISPLDPGVSMDADVYYPAQCDDKLNCSPLPDQTIQGAIMLFIGGVTAADLDAVKAEMTLMYTPPNAPPTWQVSIPMTREKDAAPEWFGAFTETPLSKKDGNSASHNMALALLNLSDDPQAVEITITDNANRPIATKTTAVLGSAASMSITLADLFGDVMPSNGQDGLFHGEVHFKGVGGGNIIPMLIRAIGNSVGYIQTWPSK